MGVVAHHFGGKSDEFAQMKTPTVVVKMGYELHGGDIVVERSLVAEVAVPDFFDGISDELGSGTFSSLVGCVVSDEDGVFGLTACPDHGCGIVGDDGVRWRAIWQREGSTPRCCVGRRWFDESNEVVCSWGRVFVVRDP